MATVTFTVQSMLNAATFDSYTKSDAITVSTLKTNIATDVGLSTDWFELRFNNQVLDTGNTLAYYGITNGSTIYTANRISRLATKELKQKAKLDLAALDRAASANPRSTYDITELPTYYDDNVVIDNPNSGFTLIPGTIKSGISKVTYAGYHGDNVAFTDTATVTASEVATNFTITSIAENITVLYVGYLLADYTGTWSFTLNSDDGSYLWIGANAISGYTTGNALTSSSYLGPGTGTISMVAGEYYPIRLLYGNGPAAGNLELTYAHTGQTATNNFTGKLFSPDIDVVLVVGRPWIA